MKMVDDAMSDVQVTVERILVDGDQMAWRWSMRDGELAESWFEIDNLDVVTQLGAIEAPTG